MWNWDPLWLVCPLESLHFCLHQVSLHTYLRDVTWGIYAKQFVCENETLAFFPVGHFIHKFVSFWAPNSVASSICCVSELYFETMESKALGCSSFNLVSWHVVVSWQYSVVQLMMQSLLRSLEWSKFVVSELTQYVQLGDAIEVEQTHDKPNKICFVSCTCNVWVVSPSKSLHINLQSIFHLVIGSIDPTTNWTVGKVVVL